MVGRFALGRSPIDIDAPREKTGLVATASKFSPSAKLKMGEEII